MPSSRRSLFTALLVLAFVTACGGGVSTLRTEGRPTGSGPAHLSVKNESGVAVHSIFVATTDAVNRARERGVPPGSSEDIELWGDDLLTRGSLPEGQALDVGELKPGRYDVLCRDRDGREQMVKGLQLKAGGRYVVDLADGWRLPR